MIIHARKQRKTICFSQYANYKFQFSGNYNLQDVKFEFVD